MSVGKEKKAEENGELEISEEGTKFLVSMKGNPRDLVLQTTTIGLKASWQLAHRGNPAESG